MTDVRQAISELKAALERIPRHELDEHQRSVLQAYRKALDEAAAHVRQERDLRSASDDVVRGARDAQVAAVIGDWDDVLRHAFASITSLPGDTGWTPIGPLPRPR